MRGPDDFGSHRGLGSGGQQWRTAVGSFGRGRCFAALEVLARVSLETMHSAK
jgi:hypothetical protein